MSVLILLAFLCSFATVQGFGAISFVGRTQNVSNGFSTSVTISTPSGIQNGDLMLVFVSAANSTAPGTPSGWTLLGSTTNSSTDTGTAFYKIWSTGDATSYTFGSSNLNYPEAIMRVYSGVVGIDTAASAESNSSSASFSLSTLSATAGPDEEYVGYFANDGYLSTVTGPYNLTDQTASSSTWTTFDGDESIPDQGTAVPAETATDSESSNWIGFALTLSSTSSGGTVEVDDTDPSVIYSSQWTGATDDGSDDFDASEHYSDFCLDQSGVPIQGAMAQENFSGTGIALIGKTGNNFGIGSYSVDGGPFTTFDAYDPGANGPNNYQQTLVSVSGLAAGPHTISWQVTCNKNPSSSDTYQVVDAYEITGTGPLTPSQGTVAGWNSSQLSLTGSWSSIASDSDLSGGQLWSGTEGNSISWTFTGSLIEVYGRPDLEDGYFNVLIDGNQVATVDGHFNNVDDDALVRYMLFATKVTSGTHTITLVVTGTHDSYATDNLLQFDEFIAF